MTLSPQDLRSLAAYRQQHGTAEGFVPTAPKKKRKNEEMVLHMACVSWWHTACAGFNVPEFLLWHTQNGILHAGSKEDRERIGGMMKRMGVRGGIPDIFIAVPRVKAIWHVNEKAEFIGHSGLFVELKVPKGTLSDEQKIVLPELERRGFLTAVCRTLEDFKLVVTQYLSS